MGEEAIGTGRRWEIPRLGGHGIVDRLGNQDGVCRRGPSDKVRGRFDPDEGVVGADVALERDGQMTREAAKAEASAKRQHDAEMHRAQLAHDERMMMMQLGLLIPAAGNTSAGNTSVNNPSASAPVMNGAAGPAN